MNIPSRTRNIPSLARRPSAPQPDFAAVPARILALLHAEGVTSLAAWRQLKGRRLKNFGITAAMATAIDAMARDAP